MNGYSEALEMQVALLHDVQALLQRKRGNEVDMAVFRALRYGDTFWLGGDAGTLVHTGHLQLPEDAVLNTSVIPARQGFVLSSNVHALVVDDGRELLALRGLLWDSAEVLDAHEPTRRLGPGVVLIPLLARGPHASSVFVDSGYPWLCGISLGEASRRNLSLSTTVAPATDGGESVMRLFLALCLFLQQRIVTAPPMRAERGTRRRLERAGWQSEPVIRVIQLRRVDQHATHDVEVAHAAHNWSCQWVVRGHWRQQPYPSMHTVQPLWITPYVKGPVGKPLKPPRATVFAVVR